jgi:hypothetical protein
VIKSVNDVLMSQEAGRAADVGALFAGWGLIRAIASGAALLCCLTAILQGHATSRAS